MERGEMEKEGKLGEKGTRRKSVCVLEGQTIGEIGEFLDWRKGEMEKEGKLGECVCVLEGKTIGDIREFDI